MRNEEYEEICNCYYKLSTRDFISSKDEQKIADILELAVEDPYLSSLIDQVDNKIYEETEGLFHHLKVDLVADVLKVKSFIAAYSDEDENENHFGFSTDSQMTSQSPAQQNLLNYVRDLSISSSPPEVLIAFQRLFIRGELYSENETVHSLLKGLASKNYSLQYFSSVIHDCLYIVVNEWLTKPDYHIFITQLIDLFEQREILKFSQTQEPCILKALLDFTQTDYFIQLFRLANCIRHQIYTQVNTATEEVHASHLHQRKPLLSQSKQPDNSLRLVEHRQDLTILPAFSNGVEPPASLAKKNRVELQSSHSGMVEPKKGQKAQASVQGLFRNIQSQVKRFYSLQRASNKQSTMTSLEPRTGVVVSPISLMKPGKVKINGVFWTAKLQADRPSLCLEQGEQIRVIAQHELTLFVEAYRRLPDRPVKVLKNPVPGLAKDPIAFGSIGRIEVQGVIKLAKLHEGFAYRRLYTNQTIKVVAKDGDLLIIAPQDPSPASESSFYKATQPSSNVRVHV